MLSDAKTPVAGAGRNFATSLTGIARQLFILAGTMPLLVLFRGLDNGFLWKEAFGTACIIFGAVFLLFLMLRLILRSRQEAYLLTFALGFFAINYLPCSSLAEPHLGIRGGAMAAIALVLLVPFALLMLYRRLPTTGYYIHIFITIFLCSYIALPSIGLVMAFTGGERYDLSASATPTLPASPSTSATDKATLPDIYYILPDMYGSFAMLEKVYGFPNQEFHDALTSRGFFIDRASTSPYPKTELTVPAVLNFDYLQDLLKPLPETTSAVPLHHLLAHNRLTAILAKAGYSTVQVSDTVLDLGIEKLVHVSEGPEGNILSFGGFVRNILRSTVVIGFYNIVQGEYNSLSSYRTIVTTTNSTLDAMDKLASTPHDAPRFVFAHIFTPHNPFVFDREGNLLPQQETGSTICCPGPKTYVIDGKEVTWHIDRRAYLEQVRYINRRLLQFVDSVQENSTRPFIIVLQGDHGPNSLLDWKNPLEDALEERFANLNAVYLPDKDYGALKQKGLAPVNTFRVILNQYLGYDLPMLERRSYFANYIEPYKFQDVSTQVPLEETAHDDDR